MLSLSSGDRINVEALPTMETQILRRKLLDAFHEQSTDAMFVHDFYGRFIDVNQQACDSLGYSRDQLLGMTVFDVEKEFDLAKAQAAWSQIKPLKNYTLYGRHCRKDGTSFPVQLQFSCVDLNNQRYYLGLAKDLSGFQRDVENAVEQERNYLRSILDSVAANIAVLDPDGAIIIVNDGWRKFKAENSCETVSEDDIGINYLQVCNESLAREDDASLVMIRDGIQSVLKGSETKFACEYPCHSPEQKRWFRMTATPLLNKYGGCVVVHTDVTKRKQAEELQAQLNAELEESNTAMKVLLKHLENEQKKLGETVLTSIRQLVFPYLEKIKRIKGLQTEALLEIIEVNLEKIVSPFTLAENLKTSKLSHQELLVANLVQEGKQDKHIAEMLNSSIHTIKAHRRNIRKNWGCRAKAKT